MFICRLDQIIQSIDIKYQFILHISVAWSTDILWEQQIFKDLIPFIDLTSNWIFWKKKCYVMQINVHCFIAKSLHSVM